MSETKISSNLFYLLCLGLFYGTWHRQNKTKEYFLKTEISIMDKDSIMIKRQQKLIQLSIIASGF